jgi:chromosome segregation ATPase
MAECEFLTESSSKVYDGKISALNLQIKVHEENIQELKTSLKTRNQTIDENINTINGIKSQLQMLKSQLDLKQEELANLMTEYEEMKRVKVEWEKKCKTDASSYDKTISDLETKHFQFINTFKQEFQIELENKNREFIKFKQIYENDYIRLDQHEEILKKRVQSLTEDRKSECEFVADNTAKIFEGKMSALNLQIQVHEENIQELKALLKTRNETINENGSTINEIKSQLQSMKTQLELKQDELVNMKKEYESLISAKDKKIQQLQSVVNQSIYSFNSGLNNIKIANKLDNEVKVLMKRAKADKNDYKAK